MTEIFKEFRVVFLIIISCLFVAAIILMIVWLANKKKNQGNEAHNYELEKEDVYLHVVDGVVSVAEAPQAAPAQAAQPEGQTIVVPKKEKKTFAQQLMDLDENLRGLFKKFQTYVNKKDLIKVDEKITKVNYSYKGTVIMSAKCKKDHVAIEFNIGNPEMSNLIADHQSSNVVVKPMEVRLKSDSDLAFAKNSVDLTMDYIDEIQEA